MAFRIALPLFALASLVAGCSVDDHGNEILEIANGSFPDAHLGQPYSVAAVARNGETPYAWSIAAGALPAGLSLDAASGTISGTPTALETAPFTLRVSDARGAWAEKSLSLTVVPPPLAIATRRLPPAQVGAAYNQTLARTGGATPVVWTVSSGALPPGLLLTAGTGALSGVPSVGASPAAFTVQVTDGTETVSQVLAIEIDPASMTLFKVRQDGAGGAFTTISFAVAAIPNPLTQSLEIEIDDDGTYSENVVVAFTGQVGTEWVGIRSAWNRLATVQAANAALPAVHVQSSRVELRALRITGSSGAAGCGVKADGLVAFVNVIDCALFGNQTAFDSGTVGGVTFAGNTCHGPMGVSSSGGVSCLIVNNVIYATGAWAIRSTGCAVDYNLYYAPTGAVGTDGTTLYTTLAAWRSFLGQDSHSLSADPLLVAPASGDLHLQASSPAKDKGNPSTAGLPVTDAEGYARGTGAGVDMGAFELP